MALALSDRNFYESTFILSDTAHPYSTNYAGNLHNGNALVEIGNRRLSYVEDSG